MREIAALTSAPAPHPKRALKREALLEEAARQINQLGAGAVSLNAVAEAAGLSRSALYYYVTDRADLAFRAYLRTCDTISEDLAVAFEQGTDAQQRICLYIARALRADAPARAVLCDQDFLPEPQRSNDFRSQRAQCCRARKLDQRRRDGRAVQATRSRNRRAEPARHDQLGPALVDVAGAW